MQKKYISGFMLNFKFPLTTIYEERCFTFSSFLTNQKIFKQY